MCATRNGGWLKIKPAAAYSGVGPRTFRAWLKNGLRHSRLPSGTVLVSLQAIDEFLGKYEATWDRTDKLVSDIMSEL